MIKNCDKIYRATHHALHTHALHTHQASQLLGHVAPHTTQHVERVAPILKGWG